MKIDLKQTEWLSDPRVTYIMAFLNDNGASDQTRFVGGCVRNAILGFPVDDIDMATLLTPEAVIELCEANDIKVIPTGLKHGTVTIIYKGKPFEVTTLRHDVETDGRHAEVAYTTSWVEDANRRDFTMNALYMDLDGNIHDYHDGLTDIQKRHVRFVGQADIRIVEDALRILRFYRFSLYYGDGFDAIGQAACAKNASLIGDLSAERVRDEMLKILRHDNCQNTLEAMRQAKILSCLPMPLSVHPVAHTGLFKNKDQAHFQLRILAGLDTDPKDIFEKYRLSKQDYYDLKSFDRAYNDLKDGGSLISSCYFYDKIPTMWACAVLYPETLKTYANDIDALVLKTFPVTGKILSQNGVSAGKAMGDMIKACEKWWVSNDMKPDLKACLAYIKTL